MARVCATVGVLRPPSHSDKAFGYSKYSTCAGFPQHTSAVRPPPAPTAASKVYSRNDLRPREPPPIRPTSDRRTNGWALQEKDEVEKQTGRGAWLEFGGKAELKREDSVLRAVVFTPPPPSKDTLIIFPSCKAGVALTWCLRCSCLPLVNPADAMVYFYPIVPLICAFHFTNYSKYHILQCMPKPAPPN